MPPSDREETVPSPTPLSSAASREIKLISHSSLFYWWPVWVFGFAMAAWTATEDNRLAVVPPDTRVAVTSGAAEGEKRIELVTKEGMTKQLDRADKLKDLPNEPGFGTHVSQHAWPGSVFVLVLLLVMVITNVPLRGLWSFVVLMAFVVIGLFITVFHGWDEVFDKVTSLRIYINLAGYLTISSVVLVVWLAAVMIFDRRQFIIFTPGQIKVCEHIGDSVRTYDTTGLTFEKQRDDLFRHYILGFGSGDLIVRTAGAERHEIKLQNVLGIGWKLKPIEDILRERATVV